MPSPTRDKRRHMPAPVGKALGPSPDVGFIAAPAAGMRRRGGGPRAGGKGMRNFEGQPVDIASMRHRQSTDKSNGY